MATTLSTRTVRTAQGRLYYPAIVRAISLSTVSSGSTNTSAVIETLGQAVARCRIACPGLAAGSTLTVTVESGAVSSDVAAGNGQIVNVTSGALTFTHASTVGTYWTVTGLNRFTRIKASEAGGSTSANLSIDAELI